MTLGRPKGIPISDEHKRKMKIQSKAFWDSPEGQIQKEKHRTKAFSRWAEQRAKGDVGK